MWILGIETSCDETAAAIVQDGHETVAESMATQEDIHGKFGGVFPELASRRHVHLIDHIVGEVLDQSGLTLSDLSAVAVTRGPGLIGALLVGVGFAKSLAYGSRLPFIGINHLEGHLYAACLDGYKLQTPFVALVVSGGHTHLFHVPKEGDYRLIGRTLDDAAGEALDKAARVMGLDFPGGPILDRLSRGADPARVDFPRPMLTRQNLDFSFSGLKTSLLRYLETHPTAVKDHLADIAASYQQAVVDVLVEKALRAAQVCKTETLLLGGGVAANSVLRQQLQYRADQSGFRLVLPSPRYCTDNAAMISAAAYRHFLAGRVDDWGMPVQANLTLSR